MTLLAELLGVHTRARDFRVGADGEVAVARRLRTLDARRWRVLHAVPVGGGGADIDHVVIGPPGVFTLNTKHHPGATVLVVERSVLVNGRPTDYLRRSQVEGDRAARLLSAACPMPVGVRPVVVVVSHRFGVRMQPRGVAVVDARAIVRWLRRQPSTLTPDEVATIFELARRESTWRPEMRSPPG